MHDLEQDSCCWCSSLWSPLLSLWTTAAKTLSQTLSAAGNLEAAASYLGALHRSSWSFWKWGSSGASHVVLDGRRYTTLFQSQLGNLTTLVTLPNMTITNMMLWWITNAGKNPEEVSLQPMYPIKLMLPKFLNQHVTITDFSISVKKQRIFGVNALTNILRDLSLLLGKNLQSSKTRFMNDILFMAIMLLTQKMVCKQEENCCRRRGS